MANRFLYIPHIYTGFYLDKKLYILDSNVSLYLS